MKNETRNVIFLCVFFFLGISSCVRDDVSYEIQKENDVLRQAFLEGFFEELNARYSDDAVLIPPNSEPIVGSEAISSMLKITREMGVTDMRFTTGSAEMHGRVAIEQGIYKMFAGEDNLIDQGKYIVIWEKHGKTWKIKKDIWNTSMPPAPIAQVNDTIMFFSFRFKESDIKKLDAFNDTYLIPAMEEFQPEVLQRITLAEDINSDDGYITRYYFVFPYHGTDNHGVKSVVMKKFNEPAIEEKINEIYSLYEILDQRYAIVIK